MRPRSRKDDHLLGADTLLRQYVEETSQIGSPRAQDISGPRGYLPALHCEATRRCSGTPRRHTDGWKCSRCQKLWRIEEVVLSKGAIGGRVVMGFGKARLARSLPSSRSQPRPVMVLDDPQRIRFSSYLDEVEEAMPP